MERGRFDEWVQAIKARLGAETSFDVVVRNIQVAGRDGAFIHLDGFMLATPAMRVLQALMQAEPSALEGDPRRQLEQKLVSYFEVKWVQKPEEAADEVLVGQAALVVAGVDQILLIDLRRYPARSVDEPPIERVTRGSREGFVETGLLNVNMVRRRLRDPHLRVEALKVGIRSKTDVFLLYVEDLAPKDLVDEIRRRLVSIRADALPMGSKNLEEYLSGSRFNPFPRVRYTERPDVTASHLLEGYVAVIVDTAPSAMILPANVWQFTQHAEEYVQTPVVGTYLRWVRFFAIVMSVVLVPLWVALVSQMPDLPPWLGWIGPRKPSVFPVWLQLLLLTLGLDIIRMALIHTPEALSTSIGLVGAVLLGQFAVQTGLFVNETILYSALAAIGSFTTPALEFALALRLFQYPLIALAAWQGLWGLAAGLTLMLYGMALTRSFFLPYLWPLAPFDGKALSRLLMRYPIPAVRTSKPPSPSTKEASPGPS
ncbi:MAG: spore germination protein [Limnochordaceae bacterium]|nr:spore germination protein [Limnochordaceae bacterium]